MRRGTYPRPRGGQRADGGGCTTPTVMVPPGWPRTCLAASFAAFFAASASFLAFFSASRLSCFSVFSTGAPSAGAGSVAGASDDIVRRVGRVADDAREEAAPIYPNTPPTRKMDHDVKSLCVCGSRDFLGDNARVMRAIRAFRPRNAQLT